MSNLAKTEETNICPSFSKSEIEIVKSSQTTRVFNLDSKEIDVELKNAIGQAILVIGNKNLSEDDVLLMIINLRDYLKEFHQYSKIGEILQAIKLGSYGQYLEEGSVLYLSLANIVTWLKKYEETKRIILSNQVKFEQEKAREEMEKENFNKSAKQYWIDLPKNIDRCRYITKTPMSSKYAENLHKLGLLNTPVDVRLELKEKAKIEIIQELRHKKRNRVQIGEDNIETMVENRAKSKCFYLWIEENKDNDIEGIVRKAINDR